MQWRLMQASREQSAQWTSRLSRSQDSARSGQAQAARHDTFLEVGIVSDEPAVPLAAAAGPPAATATGSPNTNSTLQAQPPHSQ